MKPNKKRCNRRKSLVTTDVVKARAFVLVDESDHVRASLFCSTGKGREGFTVLHLNDGAGRPRITLQVHDNNEVGVLLFTEKNTIGVSLGLSNHGNGVSIEDSDGNGGMI